MTFFSRQTGLFALALLLAGSLIAAKLPVDGKNYDYVMVEKRGNFLFVSEGVGKFEERKVKDETKDYHDVGPLFKAVNEFEARGYEV
jgi:hypothetical protein